MFGGFKIELLMCLGSGVFGGIVLRLDGIGVWCGVLVLFMVSLVGRYMGSSVGVGFWGFLFICIDGNSRNSLWWGLW